MLQVLLMLVLLVHVMLMLGRWVGLRRSGRFRR